MKTEHSEVSVQANARSSGRYAGTNTMMINGYQAVIAFDPDIQMFRVCLPGQIVRGGEHGFFQGGHGQGSVCGGEGNDCNGIN